MITIYKDGKTLTVTGGVYRSFYKKLGYKPLRSSQRPENPGEVNPHPEDENVDSAELSGFEPDEGISEDEVPLEEIPLSEMSHSQLLAYADQLELDYEPTISQKDLRKMIRQHLK